MKQDCWTRDGFIFIGGMVQSRDIFCILGMTLLTRDFFGYHKRIGSEDFVRDVTGLGEMIDAGLTEQGVFFFSGHICLF